MKRYFFGLILTLLVVGLFADYLVQIDLPSSTTLQKQVKDLTAAGCEVFHYDSSSLIGKADDAFQVRYPQYNTRKLLPLPTYQRLYLISRIDDQAQLDLPPAYHILAELKDSWLVSSMQDEVQLRGEISHPFTVLELKPIVPQKKLSGIPEIRTLERSIEDLVSLVNPDSVMWFIQSLQNFQTRYAMAPNRLEVATWIRNQFIRFGITDAELSPFQWNGTTQYNVVATIPGTLNPDKYVIVGGHHDSIVNNGDPYTWAPGADDNASGSVAALEMARVMMQQGFQPKNSIRFLTFAAEEFGLWGSKDYAETALQSEQNILLMINHDMIAYTEQNPDNWQVRLMPYDGCDNHTTYASGLTQLYTSLNPTYGTYNSPSSDSHPFWARGYPVIYYFEQTFCPYYHSDLDIVDYVNPDYCAEIIRASTAVASTYANMPLAPENLSVSDAGTGGALQLSWSNVTDPFVTHYNVYHSIYGQNFTNPQQVTPTPGATTSFTLDNLDNGTLYYVALSSVDENGSESYYILGEGTPNLYPLMPTGFADQPGLGEVLFTWDRNQELDVHVYQIYRSTDPDNLGEVYAQVPQTGDPVISFLDADFDDSNQYYYYALNVLDLSGSTSPTTEIISSRPVTLNSGILVIDETADGNGSSPFQPTDQQVDDFYSQVLNQSGYHTFEQFDLQQYGSLRLANIGIYSSILWHGNDQSDFDSIYLNRDVLLNYLELGGNLLLTTYLPSQAIALNSGYPATFDADDIINSGFGISGADYSNLARFRYALPFVERFPALEVDPDKTTPSFANHIFKVEAIHGISSAQVVFGYGSDYENSTVQGALNYQPVGIMLDHQPGKVITLSFPLYNMLESSVQQLIAYVFGVLFEEEVANEDPTLPSLRDIIIYPGAPNPFSDKISLKIDFKDALSPATVKVYNLKGQLINTIHQGNLKLSKYSFAWDGLDSKGKAVACGIYFIRAEQGGSSAIRKVMKLK